MIEDLSKIVLFNTTSNNSSQGFSNIFVSAFPKKLVPTKFNDKKA